MIPVPAVAVFAAALLATIWGDAATAAAIAGIFSVINSALSTWTIRSVRLARQDVAAAHRSVADASVAAAAAAAAASESCRVAKAIGAAIRHDDPLLVIAPAPPENAP